MSNNINESPLAQLIDWSQAFWEVNKKRLPAVFAQKGYEDKGVGHIERIISNVSELLDVHCAMVTGEEFSANFCGNNKKEISNITLIDESYTKNLEHSLILFYCSAHLHDVGMNFAGMYEALSELIEADGGGAIHVSRIIHDYHYYTVFILMLELITVQGKKEKENKKEREKYREDNERVTPFTVDDFDETLYLKHLPKKDEDLPKKLWKLTQILLDIYEAHFEHDFREHMSRWDFFIVLGLLCLFHMKPDADKVQSIIRKYKDYESQIIRPFNRWWELLNRSMEWTRKTGQLWPELDKREGNFSGWDQVVIRGEGDSLMDIHLAGALLQYGDRTEISIARLACKIYLKTDPKKKDQEQEPGEVVPLDVFIKDVEYDHKKGFICTDMAQHKLSSFARFRACRFIPVLRVNVERKKAEDKKDEEKKEKKQDSLNITIHYLRIPGDRDVFRLLRYHNEKDFHDLDFLNSLQIHLPMLLIGNKKKTVPLIQFQYLKTEHPFPEKPEDLDKLLANLPDAKAGIKKIFDRIKPEDGKNQGIDGFPYTRFNKDAIHEFSPALLDPEARNREQGIKKVFYRSGDIVAPSGFEVMAILNLFRRED